MSTSDIPVELGYFTIPVRDLERANVFYGGLFGWHFEPRNSGPGYAHVGNTKLPLGFTPDGPASLTNLYFRVEDLTGAIARVRALGGHAGEPKESPSGFSSRCRDDQDTEFNLWQPAPGY